MVCTAARTGRHLQRYSEDNCRLVVGCIPYRYKNGKKGTCPEDDLEVLLVSSRKSQAMMFPKGGWELDESVEEAASRESLEEAGVLGNVECELGRWTYKSNSRELYHQGFVFPLLVTQQLELWPEQTARKRQWMSVAEAKEACEQLWMKEALAILVDRLTSSTLQEEKQA
ncbi:Diadenosine and diphosphoinositol polyphosphate phosphohydrolase [Handroanthus impetiginosus]|uniref:Diadenosine and diphosphoinositol polyphosphate phosphohydrolase n=1 Tax=Handroanthus impetiginosus TaxID=429701 RepID=A0A2G9H0T7_9LAMI|nr:Diadenosine and diphosphoinositol polyphosphate phosphohydrolase [Handroanthus impetiginosus]